jgi:uracil-DNA glycosylase
MQFSLLPDDGGAPAFASSQLQSADPGRWPVHQSWQAVTYPFFSGAVGQGLLAFLEQRLAAGAVIFPPQPMRALELTPLNSVRVIILGQDPYHGRGQAEGLAFSVAPGVAVPPSLRNIFKELAREPLALDGCFTITQGSLLSWASRGVLLLNTCLTVEEGKPASHARRGWETLTDAVISAVSGAPGPVIFMLWGAYAQSKRALIDEARHTVLCANHPSPLSASRPPVPFIGCGHFSEANRILSAE